MAYYFRQTIDNKFKDLLDQSSGTMEIRETQLPGVLWLIPEGHDLTDIDPSKLLFCHVIPLNITYQFMLDVEVPISFFFDGVSRIIGRALQEESLKITLYWKKKKIDIKPDSELKTSSFRSGATFLVQIGDQELPNFHSGKLWQCKSCDASFDTLQDIMGHNTKNKKWHELRHFGVPSNWGVVSQEGVQDLPRNNRRQLMEEALTGENLNTLKKFVPDSQDLEWELKECRKKIVQSSRSWRTNQEKMDTDFVTAIEEGLSDIPDNCQRQMPGTWEAYRGCLHKIISFYQMVKGKLLHYRDFFAFGEPSLVHLSDPEKFFNDWKTATPEMLKKCLAAHNQLEDLIKDAAKSAEGLEKFQKPYEADPQKASTQGIRDRDSFLTNLERITQTIKDKKLWTNYADRSEAKRRFIRELENKLVDDTGKMTDISIKEDVDKFLSSNFTLEAENDLLSVATNNQKLTPKQWLNSTEMTVTRLQIWNSGRTECSDLTNGEWDDRIIDKQDESVVIDRNFTKLDGHLETFLHLDPVEACILLAYESAKLTQFPEHEFPELYTDRARQSFFVNSIGKPYMGAKGNSAHLTAWNTTTKRLDRPTDFRRRMATWTISTDQVTRANSAFVNAHSVEVMTKVYANQQMKRQEGIKVLEKYRIEELGREENTRTAVGRSKFFNLKFPPELAERQRRLRLESYDNALAKAVRVEKEYHTLKHAENPDLPASDDARSSLLELIADERKSGVPVTPQSFLADMILMRKEKRKLSVAKPKIQEAILNAIDSAQFEDHPAAISLKNILVMAASARIEPNVRNIEGVVVTKWRQQIENFGRRGVKLKGFRLRVAFMKLANAVQNDETYSVGNELIVNQIGKMNTTRNRLIPNDQTSKAIDDEPSSPSPTKQRKSPRLSVEKSKRQKIISPAADEDIQKTPERKQPDAVRKQLDFDSPERGESANGEEDENEEEDVNDNNEIQASQSPSPIKVSRKADAKRAPNWEKSERVKLLEHVLRYMEDPTRGYDRHGKADLRENVLHKLSPNLGENPRGSRNEEDIVYQYYRYLFHYSSRKCFRLTKMSCV